MADLKTSFGGLSMRNPIGIAPLDPAIAYARQPRVHADWLLRHVEAGAGYLYLGGARLRHLIPRNGRPAEVLEDSMPRICQPGEHSCDGPTLRPPSSS